MYVVQSQINRKDVDNKVRVQSSQVTDFLSLVPLKKKTFLFLSPSLIMSSPFLLFLQLVENCVCLLRNLSYQVHREVPGYERYAEAAPLNQGPATANKGGCFGSRKGKGQCQLLQLRVTLRLRFAVE